MARSPAREAAPVDTLVLCEELLASFAAAEMQLRVLAASELSYAANVRIQRNAEARARSILAVAGVSRRATDTGDLGRDEDTEELLHAALGGEVSAARSAQGPQKAPGRDLPPPSDDLLAMPLVTDESDVPSAEDDAEEQLRQLRAMIGEEEPEIEEEEADATEEKPASTSFVSFEEPADVGSLISFDEPAAAPMVSFDDGGDSLVQFDDAEEEPLVQFGDEDSLISFDDQTDPGTRKVVPDDETTQSRQASSVLSDAARRGSRPPIDEVEEFDLIPDVNSEEEPAIGAPAAEAAPSDDVSHEDLDGFDDEEATPPPTPKLAVGNATPNTRPGSLDSTAEVIIAAPNKGAAPEARKPITLGAPRAVSPGAVSEKPQVAARPAAPAKKGGPTAPSTREAAEARPRSAAIQLGAGGGKVIREEEEDELIEMGEADIDADADTGGGFSLQVEEYEDVEEEEEEEDEEEQMEKLPELQAPVAVRGPDAGEIRAMLDNAIDAARAGDNDRAILLFSDVLDGDPDNVDAHIGRGRVFLDLSDYARAMSDFTVAEDLAPENPEIQVAVGDLYFARKDYRKAIDFYNVALEMAPAYGMAYCRRGISHYYRKNYQEAVDDLTRAQKLDPDIANVATFVAMAKKKVVPGQKR